MTLPAVARSVTIGVLVTLIAAVSGCSKSDWLEEKANRAEYEGRNEEAARLRGEAKRTRSEEDAYAAWKREHNKTSSSFRSLQARVLDEDANRAEYAGRIDEAASLRARAGHAQLEDDKYQSWKRDNGRTASPARSFKALSLEEEANRAEYAGRTAEATKLRQDAKKAQEDDDKYQAWKKANGK
jgi:hypothetical protein